MQVIQTRDWPQEARDYLRQINRRPLVAVDDLPDVLTSGNRKGRPSNSSINSSVTVSRQTILKIRKVSN